MTYQKIILLKQSKKAIFLETMNTNQEVFGSNKTLKNLKNQIRFKFLRKFKTKIFLILLATTTPSIHLISNKWKKYLQWLIMCTKLTIKIFILNINLITSRIKILISKTLRFINKKVKKMLTSIYIGFYLRVNST